MKTAIGLMSGTSMDGIDAALLSTDGEARVEAGPSLEIPYSSADRALLEQALEDAKSISDRNDRSGCLAQAEALIDQRHIEAVNALLAANDLRPADIDLIGYHGQTVLHRPEDKLTVQLGKGEAVAEATGIDTVFDMRAADIASGGQGAPLVPVYHQALAAKMESESPVCFVNIGGISNITYLREGDEPLAFDTGPGNALIDQWMQTAGGIPYDAGGAVASEGSIVPTIVERYMAAPYFARSLPKSLDRFDFPPLQADAAELSDGARSLVRITALAIIAALEHLHEPPKSWIIAGGGRRNKTIMGDLAELAAPAPVISAEESDLDGDMMEAQAFAYLAVRSTLELPLTFPTTTGCPHPMTGGVFAPANPESI